MTNEIIVGDHNIIFKILLLLLQLLMDKDWCPLNREGANKKRDKSQYSENGILVNRYTNIQKFKGLWHSVNAFLTGENPAVFISYDYKKEKRSNFQFKSSFVDGVSFTVDLLYGFGFQRISPAMPMPMGSRDYVSPRWLTLCHVGPGTRKFVNRFSTLNRIRSSDHGRTAARICIPAPGNSLPCSV